MSAPLTLGQIATHCGLELRGDAQRSIRGVAPLANADADQVSFLANPKYRAQLATSRAGAIIAGVDNAALCPGDVLVAANPYVAYARVAALFESQQAFEPGVHPSAIVSPNAHIAPGASVGALCVVEDGATIHAGARIGPHCIIGPDCTVGADCRLVARVTLVVRVSLGQRVLIHPGAVLGADGFGLAHDGERWIKVPQLGGVRIGDDCEIGANCTIDRGALTDTVLEEDVRLDNQIQIAHNVVIGAHTAMAGCSAVAGSTRIGRHCQIGGSAGILGHLTIADRVTVTAMTLVTHSIRESGEYSSGTPVLDTRHWRKNAARFKHLDDLARRVTAIEKERNT